MAAKLVWFVGLLACVDALQPLRTLRRSSGALATRRAAPPAALEVVEPSYNLALGAMALGAGFGLPSRPPSILSRVGYGIGALCALFGLFIAFQTTTLRFTFDDSSFALVKSDLSSTGENVVVGGENVWRYATFVNWDFFPSESFPILVCKHAATPTLDSRKHPCLSHPVFLWTDFKETQTPEEFWNVGPGEQANSEEALAKGAKRGQVHFFPAIARVDELKASFQAKGCAKL